MEILETHVIIGVLNRHKDAEERAECYFCNGVTDCKPRDICRKRLRDYQVKKWVSYEDIISDLKERIKAIEMSASNSEDIGYLEAHKDLLDYYMNWDKYNKEGDI